MLNLGLLARHEIFLLEGLTGDKAEVVFLLVETRSQLLSLHQARAGSIRLIPCDENVALLARSEW